MIYYLDVDNLLVINHLYKYTNKYFNLDQTCKEITEQKQLRITPYGFKEQLLFKM